MTLQSKIVESKEMDVDFICHKIGDAEVWFAADKTDSDPFVTTLRSRLLKQTAVSYAGILHGRGILNKFADFGANLGTVCLPIQLLSGVRSLCVEALEKNAALLRLASEKNDFQERMIVLNMAVTNRGNTVSVIGHSAWGSVNRGSSGGQIVPAATISTVLRRFDFADVDLIKIDIEGAELEALFDFETIAALNEKVDIICESNSHTCDLFNYSVQDLWRRFAELGFDVYICRRMQLVPVNEMVAQSLIVEDVLATKKKPIDLIDLGFTIKPLTDEQILKDLETSIGTTNQRMKFVLRQEPFLRDTIRETSMWTSIKGRISAELSRQGGS